MNRAKSRSREREAVLAEAARRELAARQENEPASAESVAERIARLMQAERAEAARRMARLRRRVRIASALGVGTLLLGVLLLLRRR